MRTISVCRILLCLITNKLIWNHLFVDICKTILCSVITKLKQLKINVNNSFDKDNV